MKKILLLILTLVLLLGITACGPEVVKSAKQRVNDPEVSETEMTTLVGGNSGFTFDLYQELRETDGNLFYSPYSLSLALAMTYAGARGETEQQMADVLHFDLTQKRLHPAFNSLDQELERRGEGAKGKDGDGFRLNIVNAIWSQKDYEFMVDFLDILAENYGAGLKILDFINAPEESRVTINKWVSDKTEKRIEDLVPRGAIGTLTRLVLTNAIYFNAAWENEFSEERTSDSTFHLLGGEDVTVAMMKQTESFFYTEGEAFQAVELPYDGHEISMVILLPGADQFKAFENSMNIQQVNEIIGNLAKREVVLSMPKFEYESSFSMGKTLSEMGMPVAFSSGADFSGMTGNRELFINEVIHQAFVSVDESGTEAAAATAALMVGSEPPEERVIVTIDRPFIFLIRDIETGTILFVGRVLNPLES